MHKKIILSLVILFAILNFANAQVRIKYIKEKEDAEIETISAFNQNKIYISVGYGAPWLASFSTTSIGPIYGKAEYALSNTIGLGCNLAYANSANSANKISTISVLGRFNFHALPKSEIADLYLGFGFGYRYFKDNSSFSQIRSYPFGMDATLGFRIMVANNIGIYGEIGIAKSPFQIGLTVRI